MFCGGVVRACATILSIAAAFSRIACATAFHSDSSDWRDFQCRVKRRDPLLDGLPLPLGGSLAAGFCCAAACASWIAALVAVSPRAAVSGLASIVAPISAAIATERAKGTDMAIGWVKDDMGVPFPVLEPRLSFAPLPDTRYLTPVNPH